MAQDDVKDWLEDQRKQGIDDYFTPKQIQKGLIAKGCNGSSHYNRVCDSIARLSWFNIIEDKPVNPKKLIRRKYRYKQN